MRIIGGDLGKRRIYPPPHMPHTRPTTDFAREGLFNILENNLDFTGLNTLDLFGGTGCISFELASRGVRDLTVIEIDRRMFVFIRKTADELAITGLKVLKMDVFKFLDTCPDKFDLIFAGPPYALKNLEDLPRLIFEKDLLKPAGWFILEHTPRNDFRDVPYFIDQRNYGTTVFSFFVRGE